ncbi:Translation initiation factor IF-3 [Morella rubra]|uniref:Translation initiation factor IF-3 n=1 Tax=Morella rubra TaxID=262757 RepID=A0A6A1VH24_9ROSI|nr:Translation initiation factor IF-3 [Morella rubra]KAB1228287.1 Translation initiation factor IF-3 [Morella rubra]
MAGITGSSFPCKPLVDRTTKTGPFLLESKLFGVRLFNAYSIKPKSFSLSSSLRGSITGRYGGGGGSRFSGPGNSRGSRQQRDSDEDKALDISTIRSATVRLIDDKQNMVGVLSKSEAVQMAEDAELDLNANAFAKISYSIDQHDYSVRLRAARKFLQDGDKVKVIVNLKGRENEFRNIAIELIKRFQNDVGELASEEAKNFRDRNIFIILVPNKAIVQKAQEPPKKRDKSASNEVTLSIPTDANLECCDEVRQEHKWLYPNYRNGTTGNENVKAKSLLIIYMRFRDAIFELILRIN